MGVDVDYDDFTSGFLGGKAAAIADWRHRKDKGEFQRLCQRLMSANWRKAHPEACAEHARRYNQKPEVKARKAAQTRERRRRKREKKPLPLCRQCGEPYRRRGPFCSTRCSFKWKYHHDGKTKAQRAAQFKRYRARNPGRQRERYQTDPVFRERELKRQRDKRAKRRLAKCQA